jgi:preprotein translocase subunit SecG
MLNVFMWLLTVVLVLDCMFLILLVLVQLPKKEAGAGLAFGGAATDALFGAGSGTALTKVTKYAAGVFFALALILSVMGAHMRQGKSSELEEKLKEQSSKSLPKLPVGNAPSAPAVSTPSTSTTTPSIAPALKPAETSAPNASETVVPAPAPSAPESKAEPKATEPK